MAHPKRLRRVQLLHRSLVAMAIKTKWRFPNESSEIRSGEKETVKEEKSAKILRQTKGGENHNALGAENTARDAVGIVLGRRGNSRGIEGVGFGGGGLTG